jgi:hypothetical protein
LVRPDFRDLLDHFDAAASRHVDVEQDDVGLELANCPHGILDRLGLAQHLDQTLEFGLDARAKDPVVVDDHHRRSAHRLALMVSSTSVPSPASLRISAWPP